MSGRSAFDALIAEIIDFDDAVTRMRIEENEARDAAVAARQRLDAKVDTRTALEGRVRATEQALQVIQLRGGISDETVETLLERPVGR